MEQNPFDLLDRESARIDAFFDRLTGAEWQVPTRCPGWDRKDMLAHLSSIEDYIRACLDDRVAEHAAQAGPEIGYERLNDYVVRQRRPTDAAELLAEWRAKVAELHPRLRERGSAEIATGAGPYPCERQTMYFAGEYAIHADDAGVPVSDDERDDRLAWRLDFALDSLGEYATSVTVRAEGNGYRVTNDHARATLSAAELVEAAAGRLPDGWLPVSLAEPMRVQA